MSPAEAGADAIRLMSVEAVEVNMILVDLSSSILSTRKESLETVRLLKSHSSTASVPIVAICDATRDHGTVQEALSVRYIEDLNFITNAIIVLARSLVGPLFQVGVSDAVYLPLNIRRFDPTHFPLD